jgi:hypothetical protein
LDSELNLEDVQLLVVAVVVELNVVLHLLCLPNTLYHVLRVLGNLVDKGSYHVVLFAHDIVFCRIAVMILYFFFYYNPLLLFGVAVDAAVLRMLEQLLQLLNLEGIERVGRREGLGLQDNAVSAKIYCTGNRHFLFPRKVVVVDF